MHEAPLRPRPLGAMPLANGGFCFRVWAPHRRTVDLVIDGRDAIAMAPGPGGYFEAESPASHAGDRYRFRLDGDLERPDPASRAQPDGVHGASMIVDPEFPWTTDRWPTWEIGRHVFYELHVGAFTREGTFEAIIPRLSDLRNLGVTTIELMPIAEFPGARNWGYDGVLPFAAQSSYGGERGLKRLVDACHAHGLCVVLDVVYNHLGPEGNYLGDFGPYFTDRYRTPWGRAINYDGVGSDDVRAYFTASALHWIDVCRIDGLRLDAVHAIVDPSAMPFVEELTAAVHAAGNRLGRHVLVVAESDANDPRLVRPRDAGGQGLDGVWNDDFHHAVHVAATEERAGYYGAYRGTPDLVKAFQDGFVYTGQWSEFRSRRHGRDTEGVPPEAFVVCAQNHDQIGNRMLGERLATLAGLEAAKVAAAAVLLSPFTPLLFMGEEHADPAPFLYFIDHGDQDLIEAVRRGRAEEFASFSWRGAPPDPQDPATFERSRVDWSLREGGAHARVLGYYRELLRLRRECAPLSETSPRRCTVVPAGTRALMLTRWGSGEEAIIVLRFGGEAEWEFAGEGEWRRELDSTDQRWGGPGATLPPLVSGSNPVVKSAGGPAAALYLRRT